MSLADDLLNDLPPKQEAVTSRGMPAPAGGSATADAALAELPPKKSFNDKLSLAKFVWGTTPWGLAYKAASKPAAMSKEGLKKLAGYVPEGTDIASKIKNPALRDAAAVTLGAPRVAADTLAEFAPQFIHPSILAVEGAGKSIEGAVTSPAGKKVIGGIASKIPDAVKRAFTYRFGQPAGYKAAAESRLTNIQNTGEDAVEVGQALQKGLTNAQQLRTGQIAAGGVSVSTKELPLRLRANYARQAIDKLEAEAKSLDLIPDSALANYTRKDLAALRNKKAAIDNRVKALKNFNATTKKMPTKVIAEGAKAGEPHAVFAYNDDFGPGGTKRAIYNIFGDPAKMSKEVGWGSSQSAEFLAKHKIPIKGISPRAAKEGWTPVGPPPVVASSPKQAALDAADKLKLVGLKGVVNKVEDATSANVRLQEALGTAKEKLTAEEFQGLESIMSQETLRRSAGVTRMIERFQNSSISGQEKAFERLAKVAERAGAKIEDILESPVSIGNYRNLIKRIEAIPNRFPGQSRLIKELETKSQGIQGKIVDYYQNSGKKYVPRLYKEHELPIEEASKYGFKNLKVLRDRFKGRGYIPEDARKAMGEIKQPAYPVAKGLSETHSAVETTKLFNRVARNPQWASSVAREGFTELPKTKTYGALAGKYVHPEIARDITEMNAAQSTASKMYDSFISKWKFGKVVLNPATHFRNMMSNSILADLGGMGHGDQMRLLPKAADEVLKRGPRYEEARKLGLIGGEFFGSEIQAFRDNLIKTPGSSIIEKASGIAGQMANKIGRVYQGEEQVFKLAKFMNNIEKGMAPKAAAADAEKWLFDYGKVSPAIKALRKSPLGAPFITFTAKALPRIAESMAKNPVRFYKYLAFTKAMDKVSQDRLHLSDEDVKVIKRNTRGQSMILPIRDKTGAPYVLDLSYILPWGDVGEQGGMFGLPPSAPPAGPLKAVMEAGMNKNQFTGQQIYDPETDTKTEKVSKVSDFLGKTLAPSWMPGIDKMDSPFKGGYSFQKMRSAIKQRPDYFGRVRPMSAAIADTVFGVKASPVSPSEKLTFEMVNKKRALEDLVRQTGSKMRHPGISADEKKLVMKKFAEKYQRLMANPMPR